VARPRHGRDSAGDRTIDAYKLAVAEVFREEAGRLTGWLMRSLGDFALAEDLLQDALVAALEQWSTDGIPDSPRAWLRTVARRRAVDRLRREVRYREKLAVLEASLTSDQDNRLELIFMCCHPALAPEAQVALTLRAVCGLSNAEIARAFVVSEATLAQRLVRAKRKITAAGIPYALPRHDELDARLSGVLSVLYLMFNEGYLATGGDSPARREVAEDAAWLAELLTRLFPMEPEPIGLLALMRLHLARTAARFDADGDLVLLGDQDRARWDRAAIASAVGLIEQAGAFKRPGAYQVQAAIAACHAEAAAWAETDWTQILMLYDLLLSLAPSPIAELNRAVAVCHVVGPDAALATIAPLASVLDGYHLYHAVRGDLLSAVGQAEAAQAAQRRALGLTRNAAEQSLLRRRLSNAQSCSG
jgi:RNA polymerase sigma factor (sigma-70 family)